MFRQYFKARLMGSNKDCTILTNLVKSTSRLALQKQQSLPWLQPQLQLCVSHNDGLRHKDIKVQSLLESIKSSIQNTNIRRQPRIPWRWWILQYKFLMNLYRIGSDEVSNQQVPIWAKVKKNLTGYGPSTTKINYRKIWRARSYKSYTNKPG